MSTRRRPGLFRRLLGGLFKLGVLGVLWLCGVAAYIAWTGARDEAGPAEAIIVLGAAAYDARPSPVFEQRIVHGIHLHEQGLAEWLIFTGGFGGEGARFAESEVARRYAIEHGVPEDRILIETVSRTTRENLEQAAMLMRERDMRRAFLRRCRRRTHGRGPRWTGRGSPGAGPRASAGGTPTDPCPPSGGRTRGRR